MFLLVCGLYLVMSCFGSAYAAQGMDYSIWKLQGPLVNTEAMSSDQLVNQSAYFAYWAKDAAYDTFMSPSKGYATPGASHCRTELREMLPNGKTNAAWSQAGYHVMTATYRVKQLGTGSATTGQGSIVIGQVWSDGNGMVELAYKPKTSSHVGSFAVKEAGGTWKYIDSISIPLLTDFNVKYQINENVLKIYIKTANTANFSEAPHFTQVLNGTYYFKCGNYDQSAGVITSGTVSTTPYSVVEISSIDVLHNPISGSLTYSNGDPVIDQTVMLTLNGGGVSNLTKTVKTDANGNYMIKNIPSSNGSSVASVTITPPAIAGYTLNRSNWAVASVVANTVKGVRTGYDFVYSPAKYTVTFNSNGG